MSPHTSDMTLVLLLLSLLGYLPVATSKFVDLSHKFDMNTFRSLPQWPKYNRTILSKGNHLINSIYSESGAIFSSEHAGTHLDAPCHFKEGAPCLDQVPLENTIAEGVVIDCSKEAQKNSDYGVTIDRLQEWEDENGEIPRGAATLFRFGWDKYIDDEAKYRGTKDFGNLEAHRFPHVTGEAGEWLRTERDAKIIGSDAMSPEVFRNTSPGFFSIHIKWLGSNRLIVENLRGLEQLPPRNFRFYTVPVKYVGSTGTQVRAMAQIYEANGGITLKSTILPLVFMALFVFLVL